MDHHWRSPFQNICFFYFAFSLPAKASKKSLLCALLTLNTDRLYILFMGIRLLVQRAIHRLGCIPLEMRGRGKLCACVGNYNWNAFRPSKRHTSLVSGDCLSCASWVVFDLLVLHCGMLWVAVCHYLIRCQWNLFLRLYYSKWPTYYRPCWVGNRLRGNKKGKLIIENAPTICF